ncbi:hypothetical protein ACHAW5_003248 [Stephanodiscus triporus]|uniref:Uncharacterized protein n=1 Tax=Stephanodiscus triporus TaxID=2934178 RepID=A0ABD3NC36_9STRA
MAHTSNSISVCDFKRCMERDDPLDVDSIGTGIHSSSNRSIIPKRTHDMPSRSQSETLHHYPRDREDGLADEGSRLPGGSVTAKDWHIMYDALRQRVTISNTSSIHVYPLDPHYAYTKSYSKEDRKRFSTESILEAVHIKKVVCSTSPGLSTKESFRYLLKNNVILPEEIRGIEHLILCKSLPKLQQERQGHVRAVLSEQHRMARLKQMKIQDDAVDKLATFSALRSLRSVKLARTRAAMAA